LQPKPIGYVRNRRIQHELKLQHTMVDFLNYHGVFCWINYQPLIRKGRMKMYHRSSTGVADILGIYKGKPLAIEVKRKQTKTTDKQDAFLDRFKEEGGIAFVARSLEDLALNLDRPEWLR